MAITSSILTGGSNNHPTTSEEANAIATDFIGEGVVSTITNTNGVAPATGGFAVNAQGTPDNTIAISAGVAYVQATPTGQGSQTLRVKNSATTNLTISANSSGSTKYDWIYISVSATNAANPNTAGDNVATITSSRSSSASTDDGTPPTYSYPIAVVTVANGFSTITNGNIRDIRANSQVTITSQDTSGWNALGYTPNSVTYLGNRSYSLVFPGVNLTTTLSPGMRLRTTRTTAAPTQCTSLNGSTQYYSKSSPAGMTFTDDFTSGIWVKLNSYNGATQTLASRYNGTSGWIFSVGSTGQVFLQGFNGGVTNQSYVQSYQSVPLNKWVHIAAQLDMSAFTATTTTSYIMINGLDVPASVTRGGTNPTALVQAGNLEIGSQNGGLLPLNGKISQAFVTSAKVTQANMRTIYSQGITSSDITNLSIISAYSFNNSINDLNTTNANNLTANGSAVATNADSPFGGQADGTISSTLDYGIIQLQSFSTDTTVTVQVPEGCTIPTTGGVSAVAYSGRKVPYLFPAQRTKWQIENRAYGTLYTQATPGATVYNLGNVKLTIPIGEWVLNARAGAQSTGSSVYRAAIIGLSTANNTMPDVFLQGQAVAVTSTDAGGIQTIGPVPLSLSAATDYYLNFKDGGSSTTNLYHLADRDPTIVFVENAYI